MNNYNLKDKLYINEDYADNAGILDKLEATKIMSQLETKICKIIKSINNTGTGFFIRIPYPDEFHLLPVLITNNHILGDEYLSLNHVINLTINDDKEKRNLKIDKSRKVFTDKELDVTIIEIKPEDGIKDYLELDENFDSERYKEIYKKDEELYIIQYPNGKNSSFSLGRLKELIDKDIQHYCSTYLGSSGSPILLVRNFKVIGVHKRATNFKYNEGTLIKFAIKKFNEKYPNNMIEMVLDNNGNEDIYILNYSKYKIYGNDKINIKVLHDNSEKLDSSNVKIFIKSDNEMVYNGINKLPKELLTLRIKFETYLTKCNAMFYKLDKLIKIDLSSFLTREIEDMSYMFSDCVNLKTAKLNFDTSKVTNMLACLTIVKA